MIFYFSATGNSKYVAEHVAAATDDHLVFLRDAIRGRRYQFDVSRERRIGFVLPTYFFGVPSIVTFFLEKLRLIGYEGQYVYLVLTCGASTGGAGGQMAKLLEERELALSARFAVPMVDNYVPLGQLPDQEARERKLDAAEVYLEEICRVVRAMGEGDYDRCQGNAPDVKTAHIYPFYAWGRSTRPFVVTDECISCGLCQEICPCGAITISQGMPVWSKKKCVRCMGCLHRCPVGAIHWKKRDESRGRYVNPRSEL